MVPRPNVDYTYIPTVVSRPGVGLSPSRAPRITGNVCSSFIKVKLYIVFNIRITMLKAHCPLNCVL